MPGSISKLISLIKMSPLGDLIGTLSNFILFAITISPLLNKELSINYGSYFLFNLMFLAAGDMSGSLKLSCESIL
jgi:hypothetical protein